LLKDGQGGVGGGGVVFEKSENPVPGGKKEKGTFSLCLSQGKGGGEEWGGEGSVLRRGRKGGQRRLPNLVSEAQGGGKKGGGTREGGRSLAARFS